MLSREFLQTRISIEVIAIPPHLGVTLDSTPGRVWRRPRARYRRRGCALPKPGPIGERGQTDQSSERPAKVTLAAKSQHRAYISNGFIACGEQGLSSRHPKTL